MRDSLVTNPLGPPPLAPTQPVELLIEAADFIERRREPVTSGIPWPCGRLQDPARLVLRDERGRAVPLQTRALDRWPDGSVRWLLLDWQASLKGTANYADTATHRSYPKAGKVCGGGPSCEHNYTTGLMLHHFLTGDPRARQTVIDLAQWVIDIDDGRATVFRWLAGGATGLASSSGNPLYHSPGQGTGRPSLDRRLALPRQGRGVDPPLCPSGAGPRWS